MPKQAGWASLPRHLLVSVIRQAWKTRKLELQCFHTLQLVCKEWRQALLEYGAEMDLAQVYITTADGLSHVCRMLKSIHSIRIGADVALYSLCLNPLSACSRLSSISLHNEAPLSGRPTIDLSLLPSGLNDLDVDCFEVTRTGSLAFTEELTWLSFHWYHAPGESFLCLLDSLPKLQDLWVGRSLYNETEVDVDNQVELYLGQTPVTSLIFSCGSLVHPFRAPIMATNLQHLSLSETKTTTAALQELCLLLTGLTHLCLHNCEGGVNSHNPLLGPATNLRCLRLSSMLQSYMPLASLQLQSLVMQCSGDVNSSHLDLVTIAGLTGLTRLELIGYMGTAEYAQLQNLPVKELVLTNCPGVPEALFVPGALTALQWLHLAEPEELQAPNLEDFQRFLQAPGSERYLPAHHLRHLGALVLSLPSLVQLSGEGSLIALGMAEGLKDWEQCPEKLGSVTPYQWHSSKYMWIKPS